MKWDLSYERAINMDIGSLKFVLSQAERKFDDIISVSEGITNKSYAVLSIIIIVIPYLISRIIQEKDIIMLLGEAVLTIWYFRIAKKAVDNSKPSVSYTKGHSPKDLAKNEILDYHFDDDNNQSAIKLNKYLIAEKINNLQLEIDACNSINEKRADKLKSVLKSLLNTFKLTLALLFLYQLFRFCTSA